MPVRPTALLTNDDGINSQFLHKLVEMLIPHFEVTIAAPMNEQSWIGRAMSRRRSLNWSHQEIHGCQGWAIDGTPTDCVNIALSHFLSSKPDVVISGINIGFNTSIPLIYSSGTIAGALEGANWGIPAIATSQYIDNTLFDLASINHEIPPELEATLTATAEHTTKFARTLVGQTNPNLTVHNLNFPQITTPKTRWKETIPARLEWGSLFTPTGENSFQFQYQTSEHLTPNSLSDREAIQKGWISHSPLNFSNLR